MQLEPYIFFYGRCEEALNFYKSIFGGEITSLSRVGESPMAAQAPPNTHKNIMHANFVADGLKFMASDGRGVPPPGLGESNISLSIGAKDRAEGERVFNKLADGAKVEQPFSDAFWGGKFGMLTDKFGVDWMVTSE